jgi:hypothetical protein
MKFVILTVALVATVASAQMSGTGIGVIVGDPTGLSLKSWLSPKSAITVGAAWSFRHDGSLLLWADYTLHSFNITGSSSPRSLAFYYGIGGKVGFVDRNDNDNETVIGARVPLGLMLPIGDSPVAVFLEVVPTVDLSPDTDFGVNGGIGVHFFF